MERPVWKRAWFILTAAFAIALLVVALQWNTTSPNTRPAVRSAPLSPYIQGLTQCLHSGKTCLLS